ncbi:uncharacterized protein PAE49_004034 isoform 1-T2 [Odontesthes bonariensis]|uniref:uncharacterized protein LOC142378394 n=1 Tax=Odontesthes bonariensis TaxID=219752 RepID=UPI003F58E812
MTRWVLAKLLLLVILVFIICLPEFFTIHRVSKVNFLCLPYQPCEQGNQVKKGGDGRPENSQDIQGDICNPSPALDHKEWEQLCLQENQRYIPDSAPETRKGGDDLKRSWFMCETDNDMEEMQSNISSSALTLHLEVSVKLQLNSTESLNLTLYGRSNHSSLHLHPPEEEQGEKGDDEGQREAFYCCLSLLPISKSANHSRCLLWFANQTVLTETAKEKLPWKRTQKDEWRCIIRVVWLALLCSVLLAVASIVIRQIYRKKMCAKMCENPKKTKTPPIDYNCLRQDLNESEMKTDIFTSKGSTLKSNGFDFRTGLSPIQEAHSQNDIEILLDGNADHGYTANLHHRGHPTANPTPNREAHLVMG